MNTNTLKNKLSLIACVFSIYATQAQRLTEVKVGRPDVFSSYYQSNINIVDDFKSDKIKFEKKAPYWIVYSDRINNTTYLTPEEGSRNEATKLDYMQPVTVAEVRGEWLHIYNEKYVQKFPKLSNQYDDLGWIKADKLLLSQYALLDKSSTTRKGMVLLTVNQINDQTKRDEYNRFYSSPIIDPRFKAGYARTFEIYFILKETKNAMLLSKSDKISGTKEDLQPVVLGWMPNENVTQWNHRVCLEKNWEQDAFTEYANKEIPIYEKSEQLEKYLSGFNSKVGLIDTKKLKGKRDNGYDMRSPVLENKESIKKIGTIGKIPGQDVPTNYSILKQKLNELKNRTENINVLFAIDGTQSMKNYFPAVANSISNSINRLKAEHSKNNIKFGVVIYRDYCDGNDAVKVTPLSGNYNEIIGILKTTKCFSICPDIPESQYNGLIQGINSAGFDEKQSNVLVLVGDAGNHKIDKNGKEINNVIQLINKYKISLIGFQVYCDVLEDSYNKFNTDMIEMLENIAKNPSNERVKFELERIEMKNTIKLNFVDLKGKKSDLLVFGRYSFASNKKEMSTDYLEKNIEEAINDYDTRVNKLKGDIERTISGQGSAFGSEDFSPDFIIWLKQRGFTEDDIEILRKTGEIKVEGYTTDKLSGYQNSCYLPVVFISRNELSAFLSICERLSKKMMSQNAARKELQNSLIDECKRLLGENNSETINDKTLNQIWEIILGVPFYNETLGNIKLKDITEAKFKPEDFNNFVSNFNLRYNKVRGYFEGNYSYTFESGDQVFFWIPLKDMP